MESNTPAPESPSLLRRVCTKRFSLLDVIVAMVVITIIGRYYIWQFKSQLFAVTFKNEFPAVKLADEVIVPDAKAYKKPYDFSENWYTYNVPVWEKALEPYKGKPNVQYLEVGLFEGRSALWMLEQVLTDPTSHVTGIDPFLGSYKDKYFANIEKSGAGKQVTTITGFSQEELRKLPLNTYDIIYIDGSHAKDDVLEDAVLSARLLKEGGLMILDDYMWAGALTGAKIDAPEDFTKVAIDGFIQSFDKQFDVIHNAYQIILKKKTHIKKKGE